MADNMVVYVTGFPRSGTHWITRLLADIMGCPVRFSSETLKDPGHPPDPCVIHTHLNAQEYELAINGSHPILKPHPVIHIQRDPRDVAVSNMYYQKRQPSEHNLLRVIRWMTAGNSRMNYARFVRGWHMMAAGEIRYESLHEIPELALSVIISSLMNDMSKIEWFYRIPDVIKANEFSRWANRDQKILRKGIVGDWKNHFTRRIGEFTQERLGDLMLEEGYIKDEHWWEELPETWQWDGGS